MEKKPKANEKTIEQTDYELKARNKFPSDKKFPLTEQSKQTKSKKVKEIKEDLKSPKKNKIEQNPGTDSRKKAKRVY